MVIKLKKYKLPILCIGGFLIFAALAVISITQLVSKDIKLIVDGNVSRCETNSFTVEEFLQEAGIKMYKEDFIAPGVDKHLTDGAEIEIIQSVPFTLQADGKTTKLRAIPTTVEEALDYHNVSLDGDDKVKPAREEPLVAGAAIVINRITKETKTVTEEVPFKTKVKGDDSLAKGTKKVLQKGAKGQDKVTYEYTYSDGDVIGKKELNRVTVKKPMKKVVAKSTRGTIAGEEYKKKFTVKAYAYSGGGTTAMGTRARVGEIAVDPRVIPLGTRVYVPGYGFARAEDTGGNIKGNTIDLYMSSDGQCRSWGVRYVTIYIL